MAVPSYTRSPFGAAKRLKLCPQSTLQQRTHATHRSPFLEMLKDDFDNVNEAAQTAGTPLATASQPPYNPLDPNQPRPPRNVAAIYLRPLRRTPTHGLPVCDLQLRSFSVRQLTLAADFALRAAYYLRLPAKGPVPLPRITERWTVPKSNFVHKKSQENFERVTVRRLVQIQDGDSEVVKAWLGFLMKYCVSGVGMKANLWEYEGVGERKGLEDMVREVNENMKDRWNLFGRIGKGIVPEQVVTGSANEAVMEALGKQLGGLQAEEIPGEAANEGFEALEGLDANELPRISTSEGLPMDTPSSEVPSVQTEPAGVPSTKTSGEPPVAPTATSSTNTATDGTTNERR